MLLKHFNQWRSPLLLPIALCGDTIPAQALAGYMCGHGSNAHIPQSYHSATHHYDIDIPDLMAFLTELIKTSQDKARLLDREYFRLHRTAIEKMATRADIWLQNESDVSLKEILIYAKKSFLPLPSNNQFVEAGVKDAALCRRSGRSERIASLLKKFSLNYYYQCDYRCNTNIHYQPIKSDRNKTKER